MARSARPPVLRPRFTLGLLYLFAFFFVYCFALAGPALWEVARTVPVTPEMETAAQRAAQEAVRGRLGLAFGAALLTTAFGVWRGWLPGTR